MATSKISNMTKVNKTNMTPVMFTGFLFSLKSIGGVGIGSAFVKMFPAWISLAGAIVLLVLASKHMKGGRLARPFILIGLGTLVDALTQIITSFSLADIITAPSYYPQIIFVASLLFRLSVVLGAIWIAGIFGVLHPRKKQNQVSQPNSASSPK